MATKWITTKSDKKKDDREKIITGLTSGSSKIEKTSWIKKKPKEYDPTEATAHMRSKKHWWIKKKNPIDMATGGLMSMPPYIKRQEEKD